MDIRQCPNAWLHRQPLATVAAMTTGTNLSNMTDEELIAAANHALGTIVPNFTI